jgi:hypothetical protein
MFPKHCPGRRGRWLLTESEHPPDTRIGALRNYTDRLAAVRTHLPDVTVLVAIDLGKIAALFGCGRTVVCHGGQRLLYRLNPVDYLTDLVHGPVGPLQLFPTSIVQRLAL